MLLWIRFPEKGRELHRHEATHKMGAEVSQRELLGQTFTELGQALLTHWQMPSPLVRMAEDASASESIVRSAQLAIRFARHTESGWSHPDVLTDLKDLSGLLGLSMTATRELMAEIEP